MKGPPERWISVEIFLCGIECVTAKAKAFCPKLWVFIEIPAFFRRAEFLPSAAITSFALTVFPEDSLT